MAERSDGFSGETLVAPYTRKKRLLLREASSNLVGGKSKWYFIIKFSSLVSIILCWREIRPDAGKTTENKFVASFLSIV